VAARDVADAMYRAACECCHQHERLSRIIAKSTVEDELDAVQQQCSQCTETLSGLVASYEEAAASLHPTGGDTDWWHRANALWQASREYLRRSSCCDTSSRELKQHDRERLGALHADYELEASAVLALHHSAEAYKQSRPAAQ
jgi:hypothetical protein